VKRNKELLIALNSLPTDKLSAINQHMVNSELGENCGFLKLYKANRMQAMNEMHHAKDLLSESYFLMVHKHYPNIMRRTNNE
jgi:bacterioferritin